MFNIYIFFIATKSKFFSVFLIICNIFVELKFLTNFCPFKLKKISNFYEKNVNKNVMIN